MKFLFVLIISIAFFGNSQTLINTQNHDFGELYASSDRFVDIQLTTQNTKKNFLLRIKKPNEVASLVKGTEITADSSITIRLQVNPKEKGSFRHVIEIYTSDKMEPFEVILTGNLKEELPSNFSQNCPAFGTRASAGATNFAMNISVIDASTKRPIAKSVVHVLQNGKSQKAFKTDPEGRIIQEIPLGFSYFYASKEGYESAEIGTYVNSQRNELVLELKKNPLVVQQNQPVTGSLFEEKSDKEEPASTQEKAPDQLLTETIVKEEKSFVPTALAGLPSSDFSADHFKPVNVTFVLDISSSMKAGDKMELLKYSLNSLNQQLRSQDKISVVTYADNARTLVSPIAGDEKMTLEKEIADLKASGLTAGGEGIKLGYKENLKGFIPQGANHVIVITDGAFNRNSKDYEKHVRKFKRKGITLSIVGIKNKPDDAVEMTNAAQIGGGRYIPIMKLVDAQNNLFQEIRTVTYRY